MDLFITHEPPDPLLVLLDQAPDGGSLQCPVLTMDGAVTVCLSPDPSSRGQRSGRSGRGGNCVQPELAMEALVHTPPNGMQDPLIRTRATQKWLKQSLLPL